MSDDRYERWQERREERERRRAERRNQPSSNWFSKLPSLEGLSGPELEAQLRKRIETRLQMRQEFFIHLFIFVAINAFLWFLWATVGPASLIWPSFVTIPWSVGLILHGLEVYKNSSLAEKRRARTIDRELELEKLRLGITDHAYEKPKRDQAVRLTDDGEIVPVDDDEVEMVTRTKR
jgi:hypothetical protein